MNIGEFVDDDDDDDEPCNRDSLLSYDESNSSDDNSDDDNSLQAHFINDNNVTMISSTQIQGHGDR